MNKRHLFYNRARAHAARRCLATACGGVPLPILRRSTSALLRPSNPPLTSSSSSRRCSNAIHRAQTSLQPITRDHSRCPREIARSPGRLSAPQKKRLGYVQFHHVLSLSFYIYISLSCPVERRLRACVGADAGDYAVRDDYRSTSLPFSLSRNVFATIHRPARGVTGVTRRRAERKGLLSAPTGATVP